MKKLFLSIASTLAVLGAIFALSTAAKAGGSPYIALSSQNGSWTVTSPQDLTVSATVFPTTAKITHIYIYSDSGLIQTCTATRQCTATIAHPTIGDHSLFVFAVDSSNAYYYLNGSYTQKFTVVPAESSLPTVTLTQTGTAYADSGTGLLLLRAKANGTQLTSLLIHRLDDPKNQVASTQCINQHSDCTIGWYPKFTSEQIGKTYTFQAVVKDAKGHTVTSSNVKITVVARNTPTPQPTGLNPVLGATPSTLAVNQTLTLSGTATNANGVWGVEVRALPSWTNVALRNRCILGNKPTTGSCSMNIGSFAGHVGQSVKVWVIYWDAKTGLGYSSEMQTITLTK